MFDLQNGMTWDDYYDPIVNLLLDILPAEKVFGFSYVLLAKMISSQK